MALTYTDAGHQAQLDAYHAGVVARDWATALDALVAAVAIETHLAQAGSVDGLSLARGSAKPLLEKFDDVRAAAIKADAAASPARFAVSRTNFTNARSFRW